jgi:hypothetical protein
MQPVSALRHDTYASIRCNTISVMNSTDSRQLKLAGLGIIAKKFQIGGKDRQSLSVSRRVYLSHLNLLWASIPL